MDESTADAGDMGKPPPSSITESSLLPSPQTPRPALGHTDLDAYTTFYQGYVAHLVAFLIWQGACLSDAENFAQEAMVSAYKNWTKIEHPSAWVRRVASRMYARHIARVEEIPVEAAQLGPLLPSTLDIPKWEERHEILRLLALLPPRQRQVMAWWLDGYSPSEISDELNITAANARANLMRARRTIAMHLGLLGGGSNGQV